MQPVIGNFTGNCLTKNRFTTLALCVFYLMQGDVWLCMEVMDVSLDKFYRVLDSEDRRIPEHVLRKIAVDVCCNQCLWLLLHSEDLVSNGSIFIQIFVTFM